MKIKTVVVAPLALALGLVASGSTAAALHGSVCQPESAFNVVRYDQWGVRPNQQQQESAAVVCPLVRDSGSADFINAVVVETYDRHATLNVKCTLTLTDQDGTTLFTEQQFTTGADSAVKQLIWSNANIGAYYGSIRCVIPGTAGTVAPYAGWDSHVTTIYVQ